MKEFLKRLEKETLWGGIFALIAMISVVVEMFLAGLTAEAVVAAVKDISGTIVAFMVFWVAAKHILKQIMEAKSLEDRLKKALDGWQMSHANMVVRKEQYDYEKTGEPATCFSFGLKTNISDFYRNAETNNTGWFLRMPLLKKENYQCGNILLKFHLNKGTFFEGMEMSKEELSAGYNRLNSMFVDFINSNYAELVEAKGKDQDIFVTFKRPVETSDDIDRLVSVINAMYNAYLVAANLKIKRGPCA